LSYKDASRPQESGVKFIVLKLLHLLTFDHRRTPSDMAQSAGIIDSEPRIQKPMLAHFRDGSSEHIDLKDKEVRDHSSKNKALCWW